MEDIIIFDDIAQTETTLVLNKDGNVIGVETYFLNPRQTSSFFNRNAVSQKPPISKVKRSQIRKSMQPMLPPNFDESPDFGEPNIPPDDYNHNVRFEVQPCGGPRQRPCR